MTDQITSFDELDLPRYCGLWYEIGRLPLRFEPEGSIDITAHYSINDDQTVRVDNRSIDPEGKPSQAIGTAEGVEGHRGRLKVSFLPSGLQWIPLTKADYWVLHVDADYQVALVGTPNHKNLWLLARENHVSDDQSTALLRLAAQLGFDLGEWIVTPQTGGRVTDEMLAS